MDDIDRKYYIQMKIEEERTLLDKELLKRDIIIISLYAIVIFIAFSTLNPDASFKEYLCFIFISCFWAILFYYFNLLFPSFLSGLGFTKVDQHKEKISFWEKELWKYKTTEEKKECYPDN